MRSFFRPFLGLLTFLCIGISATAQQPATLAAEVQQALEQKRQMMASSIVQDVPFENIGPSVMSGRVVDLDVNPEQPSEFYVGYASGGLWYTDNNGTTFEPVLDNSDTQNVGDIAVDWKHGTIWVGTGENNSSRSSYAGIGILKSTDKGKTWKNVGLPDSHHIGRIIINPTNSDEVVVGVVGHLYSDNTERGVYKTTDGGNTWTKTLFVNAETGIIDVAYAPGNFNIQYAAAWDKDRKAWNFEGAGNGSGVYKSTDAGSTWNKLSNFPSGDGVGRIGITVYDDNTVYVVHDSQFRREAEGRDESHGGRLTKDDFKTMSREAFLALDNDKLNGFLKQNNFQEKYRASTVKTMVRESAVKPIDLARYLEDANSLLFDTPVVGAEVYRSNNGGQSWKKTHEGYLDDIFYSYGYYFAQIHVNPQNKDHIYIYGVPIVKSKDGGKTFTNISRENVHADHHSLWINPKNPNHLINGNDGGVNITYDDGENWIKANDPSVGQFYYIQVDNEEPYNVYGGLQDNGVWVGANTAQENKRWHQSGQYPWESIMGGDGMQVQVDSRDANVVYTGFQFGNYFRINRATEEIKRFNIKHELGENPYRFNWQTPILLSPHNQDIVYFGGNKLLRSLDQGDSWTAISDDLTTGGKKGNVAYGTLSTISESPFQFGLIYVGSDDGYIHVTKNGGGDWQRISNNLPKDLWVSRIVASEHKKERVYATLNGYRWDDFKTYVYVSENYGQTWTNISGNIPASPVNAIVEDPKDKNIIYVGTDNGVYVSMDMGGTWHAFAKGLTAVAVHDLKIQKRDNHLLVGTHGRSIYKADISLIQELDAQQRVQLFDVASVRSSPRWGNSFSMWGDAFEPKVSIPYYLSYAGKFSLVIKDTSGNVLQSMPLLPKSGIAIADYDLTITEKGKKALEKANDNLKISEQSNGKYYLPKGKYTVVLDGGGGNSEAAKTELEIK